MTAFTVFGAGVNTALTVTLAGHLHIIMQIMRFISFFLLLGVFSFAIHTAEAQSTSTPKVEGRYASIIVDLDNQQIIHARQIDTPRYPASLTKVMTLYLTFEAIDRGKLRFDQRLPVSAYAASQPRSKLGLKRGETILVRDAINAMIVRSANDVAVVLAEAISGSESRFADLMTQRARDLGMQSTVFKNPHGLPNSEHITTARDMAKLAHRMVTDHRTYYPLFSQEYFTYKGQTTNNTNSLLGEGLGVDGLKTGYTRASGYNLTISAAREGRRLLAVVLGGASGQSRDQHMRDLVERGFDIILGKPAPAAPPRIIVKREPVPAARPVQQASASILKLRGSNGQIQTVIQGQPTLQRPVQSDWSLFLGEFTTPRAAQNFMLKVTANQPALAKNIYIFEHNQRFQARLRGLSYNQAGPLCTQIKQQGNPCVVVQHTAR